MVFDKKVDFEEIKKTGIDPDTVITTDAKGNPLSRFKDDIWDFSFEQGHPLNFASWLAGEPDDQFHEIKLQLKTIWFVLLVTPETRIRGKVKAFQRYHVQLRKVARLAHRVGCSFANASDNSEFQVAIRQSIANILDDKENIKSCQDLSIMLRKIHYINEMPETSAIVGVSLFRPDDFDQAIILLKSRARVEKTIKNRTPLIPSRIYSLLINSLSRELDYAESYLETIRSFFHRYYTEMEFFAFQEESLKSKFRLTREKFESRGEKFPFKKSELKFDKFQSRNEAARESGLSNLFETRCKNVSYKALMFYLMELQKLCAMTCLVVSGMRTHELQVLPYHCIERVSIKGFGDVAAFKSHTSKLNNGEYTDAMLWVTNELGEKAVRVAQVIAECFYIHGTGAMDPPNTSKLPLWLSSKPNAQKRLIHYDFPMTKMGSISDVKFLSSFTIAQEDIDELETFDALREWNLSVGDVWPYTNHQCRRALVVYASRSGMVSLPSLGSQLKHLSIAMTALYAENSSFAENFIIDEEGNIPLSHNVVREFREEQVFNMSLSFHEKVIDAKSRLSGGKGKIIQKDKDASTLPAVMSSRKATEKGIREGRVAYRETVVGGCMRKEVCDSYGIDDVIPCVFDCAESIIGGDGGKKLKAYAEDLEWGLDDLDEDSAYSAPS